MPTAREWLEPRLASAPEELAAAIRSSLDRWDRAYREASEGRDPSTAGEAPVDRTAPAARTAPETLARAALLELDAVVAGGQGRAAALRLLAADALLTYAFEAAAELGHDIQELADRLGPGGALGRRLEEALATVPAPRRP